MVKMQKFAARKTFLCHETMNGNQSEVETGTGKGKEKDKSVDSYSTILFGNFPFLWSLALPAFSLAFPTPLPLWENAGEPS